MPKVSAAKKQRERKRRDKLSCRKEKAEKMRKVLASLAVIAPPPQTSLTTFNKVKHDQTKSESKDNDSKQADTAKPVIVDKDAMYKEMRSSKTMKRKWRDSNTARTAKPKAASDSQQSDDSSEEDEYLLYRSEHTNEG